MERIILLLFLCTSPFAFLVRTLTQTSLTAQNQNEFTRAASLSLQKWVSYLPFFVIPGIGM